MRKPYSLAVLVLLALPSATGMLGVGPAPVEAGPKFHCNQVNMHPGALSNGQVLVTYADTLWLTPANVALQVTVTSVVGTVPPGLGFVPGPNLNQVTLTGTPLTSGTYTFTVELGGIYVLGTICKVSRTYTVTIAP